MNNKNKTKYIAAVAGLFLFGTICFAIENHKNQTQPLPVKEVQRFANAISQIKSYYVHPVSDQDLFDNAITGMLAGLDPHSNYLNAEEFQELTTATKGEFSGIGLEVTQEDGYIKVISALDDSPASKKGIKAGDLVISIDQVPLKGLTLKESVAKMRGTKGSHVSLLVLRKGQSKPIKFDLVRDSIYVKSVKSKLYDDTLGYIRISNFQASTAEDLSHSIESLMQQAHGQLKGLILDLRNNPGGLLDAAIDVSDIFLDSKNMELNKVIVSTKGRAQGSNFKAEAKPGDSINGVPMIVMINQGSASAAEIVAGALQDHKRAILVGEKSFGKGSVQTVLPLDENTAIKLTTALYFTPSGRSIQAEGIKPNVVIPDIDMTNAKEKKSEFEGFKEANLSKHLQNANDKETKEKTDETSLKTNLEKSDTEVAYSDYQLYQAINLLRGLVAMKGSDPKKA